VKWISFSLYVDDWAERSVKLNAGNVSTLFFGSGALVLAESTEGSQEYFVEKNRESFRA
jgi:hypothetical protein